MPARDYRIVVLLATAVVAAVALLFVGPIPQDPDYHRFADSAQFLGVGNFFNVASNIPFVLAGLFGLARYKRLAYRESATGYLVLCVGVLLVGAGSAYYHLAPSNESLVCDRLPMTVAFMALLSLLLDERVPGSRYRYQLLVLVALGAGSVFYWSWTEHLGRGDLRPYILVQFLPVVLIPLILFLYPRKYLASGWLLWAFAFYVGAKLLEHLDAEVLAASGFMSGHSLKHLAAAAAATCLILAVPTRRTSGNRPVPGRD